MLSMYTNSWPRLRKLKHQNQDQEVFQRSQPGSLRLWSLPGAPAVVALALATDHAYPCHAESAVNISLKFLQNH